MNFPNERNPEKCYVYVIHDRSVLDLEEIEVSDVQKWLDENQELEPEPKNGDIIVSAGKRYRNDDLWFILIENGEKKVIEPYAEIDDYGSVPPNFRFPDFPVRYYDEIVSHNFIMYCTPEICQKIINGVKIGNCPILEENIYDDLEDVWSEFTHDGKTYYVFAISEELKYPDEGQNFTSYDLYDNFIENVEVAKTGEPCMSFDYDQQYIEVRFSEDVEKSQIFYMYVSLQNK